MTIGELKELIDHLEDDVEVRLAMQPNYPLEYTISEGAETPLGIFYLAEGTQLGYLPERIIEAVGWDVK